MTYLVITLVLVLVRFTERARQVDKTAERFTE